jgi:hypothetical protein
MAAKPRSFENTVDAEDFIRLRFGKTPEEMPSLTGFGLSETISEGIPGLSYVLDIPDRRRRGRAPEAIPVALAKEKMPQIKGDYLFLADVGVDAEGNYELQAKHKQGVALRTFRTGLVTLNGGTKQHLLEIGSNGRRLSYHGAIPLTFDAAKVVGEAVNMMAESVVVHDDRLGRLKGALGVPEKRMVTVEAVVGGPILVGQVDGRLSLQELGPDGLWKKYDVTTDEGWVKAFLDLAQHDAEYLKAIAEDEAKTHKRQRNFRVIRPPVDHPDG